MTLKSTLLCLRGSRSAFRNIEVSDDFASTTHWMNWECEETHVFHKMKCTDYDDLSGSVIFIIIS